MSGTVEIELYRVDKNATRLEDLTDFLDTGVVGWQGYRDEGAAMSCEIALTTEIEVDPLSDLLMPVMRVTPRIGPVIEEPLGVYLLDVPSGDHVSELSRTTFPGQDITTLLDHTVVETTYNIAIGTQFDDVLEDALELAGITRFDVRVSNRTAGRTRTYWPGTTAREWVDDVAQSIGWYSPFAERNGLIRTFPYLDFASVEPSLVITPDNLSDEPIRSSSVPGRLANRVIAIKNRPDESPLVWIEDLKRSHPLSFQKKGRRITKRLQNADAETLADLKAIAREELQKSTSFYETVELMIDPMPRLGIHRTVDLVGVETSNADLSGRYYLVGWEQEFDPENLGTRLELLRLVPGGSL